MDDIAGPSNANSPVFSLQISTNASSGRDPSYYSNIEPDFKWMRNSVNHLISLVELHFDEFYDKTVKKKVLWKKIAEEMRKANFNCTSDDCDKKWRNIKKSYVGVLQKQVQGDFSSKFPYFDQMHGFLGREIDPLGMREQGLTKAIRENAIQTNVGFPRIPYYEVTEDDNFVWSESAVHLLLDLILEHKEIFKVNADIDSVWESITNKMQNEGYNVLSEQCQRKWGNLSDGFQYYHGEAEVTGIHPTWGFYSRVRHVISTLNVPITVIKETKLAVPTTKLSVPTMKGSLTTPVIVRKYSKKRKRRREMPTRSHDSDDEDDDYNRADASRDFFSALRRLHQTLKAEERLSHLESRIEAAQKSRASARHSNNMLGLILGELKRINKSFEERKEQYMKEQEQEVVQRFKTERLLLNHVDDHTPIVDEAACRQAILNMQDLTSFQFMKAPKVELVEGNDSDGIIIVEGL